MADLQEVRVINVNGQDFKEKIGPTLMLFSLALEQVSKGTEGNIAHGKKLEQEAYRRLAEVISTVPNENMPWFQRFLRRNKYIQLDELVRHLEGIGVDPEKIHMLSIINTRDQLESV